MSIEFASYPFTAAVHGPSHPPLVDGQDPRRHRVVVVGGGPVGYTTALGLARFGVPVLLLEADDGVCFGSRAICISRRSLEIIGRVGSEQQFLTHGLAWTGGRSFYRDQEVLHFQMPQDALQKRPPMVNLAQYSIEQYLLDEVQQRSDLIEVRWQSRVCGITQDARGATLQVQTPGLEYTLQADWVVAADGGRSFLREALGLKLQGTSYEGRYVIVDILLDSARATERLAYFDPPCNPGSTVLVHKQPNNVWRIDYQLRDGEDPDQAILPEQVMPRVQSLLDMMGETGSWKPIWSGIYKANALTLPDYRCGRTFFAGDAAHLVPIFGVRGANSGIDDADNLAWKLAHVARGWASEALLDSYSQERVAATHENLRYGTKSTEFMAPPSFAFDWMRTAVLGLAQRHPQLSSLINPRQTSAIAYKESALNAPALGPAFHTGPAAGTVLPECPILRHLDGQARAGHMTDLLQDAGWVLLAFVAEGPVPTALQAAAARLHAQRKVPVHAYALALQENASGSDAHDRSGQLAALYGATPGTVYAVRPDGHVLGRWQGLTDDATAAAVIHSLEAALGAAS
ncbi:oxygenase [Comamonas phosphati]|nr:oxygenase [Comamonas phosphati]